MANIGGAATLVMLPLESNECFARELTKQPLYEMNKWFEKYVKNTKPRNKIANSKQ